MRQFTTVFAGVLLIGSAWAQGRTLEATASVAPKAPATGENRLEVVFTESGKPVTGLKLTSSVAMTNMDMGTAHPAVKEPTPGHYVLRPMLLMSGPWRVTLVSAAPEFKVNFDLTAGGKQAWTAAKQTIIVAGSPAKEAPKTEPPKTEAPKTEPAKNEPPKQKPPKSEPDKTEPPKAEPAKAEPLKQGDPGYGGHDIAGMGHAALSMPQLKEKSTYDWAETMDWDTRTGFGKLEPMVGMMILMMVGGSGMEGMKMAPMGMKFDAANFVESGDQPVKDMPGMDMGDKSLKVEAKLDKAAVGNNNVTVTITTPEGKPVEMAKITTAVAMTSMDMGTTHPAAKELGKGKYALTANFSMGGPWRLTLIVTAPNMKPTTYTFDFEAK